MNDKPTKYEDLKINCPHCNKQIKFFYPIPALSQYHPDMYISQEMEYQERKALQTRWNKLREWINTENCKYHYGIRSGKTLLYGKFLGRLEVLDKINELEGKD